jgi:hypothetical protein
MPSGVMLPMLFLRAFRVETLRVRRVVAITSEILTGGSNIYL